MSLTGRIIAVLLVTAFMIFSIEVSHGELGAAWLACIPCIMFICDVAVCEEQTVMSIMKIRRLDLRRPHASAPAAEDEWPLMPFPSKAGTYIW